MKGNVWKKRAAACLFFFLILTLTPYASVRAAAPKLSAKKLELTVGTDAKLNVSHAGKKKVTWKTSNSKIVSIKKSSSTSVKLMAGKKTGSATVTAKVGKKTLKCKVKVVNLKFSMTNGTTIEVGGTTAFKFNNMTAKNFTSTNPKVAKVSKKGKVTGLKKGTCYIDFNIGRYRWRTSIKVINKVANRVVEKPAPGMTIGTFLFGDGGGYKYVSAVAKTGESAALDIENSAEGCFHRFNFYVNGKDVSSDSGFCFSSSNPAVLSYYLVDGNTPAFISLQDGKTELKISYGGNTYKFIITISDRDSAAFSQRREEIYRSLGINSGMPRQYICYLLASWICDHIVYDPEVINQTRQATCGLNTSYKDYFRHGTLVCAGYADLYMYLCAGLDIPCRQVQNQEMYHAWNQIQIDGNWYNVDCCWMDTATDGAYSFQYFLVSDSVMNTLSDGKHLNDSKFPCTDTRFDGCIQEQIVLQGKKYNVVYDRPYDQYSYMNPWVTGSWVNY